MDRVDHAFLVVHTAPIRTACSLLYSYRIYHWLDARSVSSSLDHFHPSMTSWVVCCNLTLLKRSYAHSHVACRKAFRFRSHIVSVFIPVPVPDDSPERGKSKKYNRTPATSRWSKFQPFRMVVVDGTKRNTSCCPQTPPPGVLGRPWCLWQNFPLENSTISVLIQ